MRFEELALPEPLGKGIAEAGFIECTPIQELTLPLSLSGRDVAGKGQTGTGKTAAFLITLYHKLLQNPAGNGGRQPRALILAPTRELVVQIEQDARQLGSHCGFSIQAVYGGVDYDKQRTALQQGVDILIGTPGRLIDYLKQKIYSLAQVEMLVIDEADRMFDLGFIGDLRFLMRRLPPYDQRQNLMFSATLNHRVMELAYEFMNMPEKIIVKSETITAANVEEILFHVGSREKFALLLGLLQREQMTRTMVFVNTKREGERLHGLIEANGFTCRMISGDVAQQKRLKIMRDFKEGSLPILIATDVASRGLHIEGVSHVVNYDLPEDPEDYVHRIGRTARAGAEGMAVSLVDEEGALSLEAIEEYIGHQIPIQWAEDELFVTEYVRPKRPKRSKRRTGGTSSKSSVAKETAPSPGDGPKKKTPPATSRRRRR
ncbi:DEAD/DEAH box helicase [Desulfobulbus propionicus]|jgi:ATP-dependent RNA helicase RhlB